MEFNPFSFIIVSILLIGCADNGSDFSDLVSDPNCMVTTGDNYVVFEAESTNSDLGNWELITSNDPRYRDQDEVLPINGTHLEFTGNNTSSGPADSPLEYTFKSPSTGIYRLTMRLYQRLVNGDEEDKSNDVFIRMKGNFTSATEDYATEDLKTDLKFFGRGVSEWGTSTSGDGGSKHKKSAILYNFIEGEEYTFTMSGRSQNANIDYILFFDTSLSIKVQGKKDLAAENPEDYRPDFSCSQKNQ